MTRRVGKNIDGFAKLILSASTAFVVSCVIICALASFVTPWLYNKVGIWLATAWNLLVPHRLRISSCHNGTETIELRSTSSSLLGDNDSSIDDDEESKFDFESESDVSEDEIRLLKYQLHNRTSRFNFRLWISRVKLLFPIGTIIVLRIVRPQGPYGHMSNTLPFTLLDVFAPERSDLCQAGGDRTIFPFPQLINSTFWETPSKDGFPRITASRVSTNGILGQLQNPRMRIRKRSRSRMDPHLLQRSLNHPTSKWHTTPSRIRCGYQIWIRNFSPS